MFGVLLMSALAPICGFTVKSVEDVPDLSAKMWRMTYEKNGADLVWLDCADENRAFVIGFKTLPEDDTGVAHILEHSVLCGSEKYPSREPFVELLKSSPHTYLNAFTAEDQTAYPVASRNERDFHNLMEVYLDAVFHPLSVKSDWAMRQEGWHYEYDGTNVTRSGIVYSEMKGALASPMTIAYQGMSRLLYPNTVYQWVSGGDPKHIPELTHEKYCRFHERYYHPSNARIYLYGKIDLKKTLPLIAAALEPYERKTDFPEIQTAIRKSPGRGVLKYASSEVTNKTIFCEGAVAGMFDETEKLAALDILCDYLTGSNAAPLKAPFLSEGICEDVAMFVGRNRQPMVMLVFKNVKDGEEGSCHQLAFETMRSICEKKFDAKRIAQLLDKHEFGWREYDTAHRGISFYHEMSETWLYGGDPAQNLRKSETFAALREKNGTGWFEDVLMKTFFGNPHSARLRLVPSQTFAREEAEAEATELKAFCATQSEEQLKAIAEAASELKRRHEVTESKEVLDKLPRLSLKDMPEACELPRWTVETNGVTTVVRPDLSINGFFYLDLCFALNDMSEKELSDVPLLAKLLGELGSATKSAAELKGLMDGTFGSFSAEVVTYETGPRLVIHIAALDSNRLAALKLVSEVLLTTDFSADESIQQRRVQLRTRLEDSARGRASRELAGRHAMAGVISSGVYDELLKGLTQLRHLQNHEAGDIGALAKMIFTRPRLTVVAAGKLSVEDVKSVIDSFPNETIRSSGTIFEPKLMKDDAFYRIDGKVAYATAALRLPEDIPYSGAHLVAAKIVSLEQLWPEIRVKGGAYGSVFQARANGTLLFTSYRDPNPARTYVEYAAAGEKLKSYLLEGGDIEKYQVSQLERTDPNLSPNEKLSYIRSLVFNGRTGEHIARVRREILSTTREQLIGFAETLKALPMMRCTIGAKDLSEGCAFEKVESVIRRQEER